jgi:hypothetical protein
LIPEQQIILRSLQGWDGRPYPRMPRRCDYPLRTPS